MDNHVTLTPKEVVAKRKWLVTTGCLANWRVQGKGPKYIKRGWAVFYSAAALDDFERANPWVRGGA